MVYTYIELVGCIQLELNNIHTIRITFTDMIQLILGRNGSGKSSIMEHLSPLPPDPSLFAKDGYRFIKITHRGNFYELKNWFTPSPKHSFIKNGEEMNPGRTGNVQKELARQEFGFTSDIDSLAQGFEKFTEMSPSRRRDWLTQLSTVSYDFAIGLYDKLSKQARDKDGALREAVKRLGAETAKLISEEERIKLREDVSQAHKELSVLLSQRAPVTQQPHDVANNRRALLEEIGRIANRLLRTKIISPYGRDSRQSLQRNDWCEIVYPTFNSVQELEEHISYLKEKTAKISGQNSQTVAAYDKLMEKMKILSRTGNESLNDLKERHKSALEKKLACLTKLRTDLEFKQPTAALAALQSLGNDLAELLLDLPINSTRKYSSQALEQTRQEEINILNKLHKCHGDISIVRTRIEHMEGHQNSSKAECPSCNHRFVVGFNQRDLDTARHALDNLGKIREGLEKDLAACREAIQIQASYGEKFKAINQMMVSRPALMPLWNHIGEQRLINNSPAAIVPILYNVGFDLIEHVEAAKFQYEADEIESLIKAAEQVGDANLQEVREEAEYLAHQLNLFSHDHNMVVDLINECETYRRQLLDAMALGDKLKKMMDNVETLTHKEVEMLRLQSIQHCIEHLQYSISRNEQLLRGVEIQESLVKDLEEQIAKLTRQQAAYKLIVHHLSPTKGLIADGLLGFIRVFTMSMNAVIKKIWTYPLEVMPCGVSVEGSAELDYKFPLKVVNSAKPRPDVSKGSTAMKEIINLAFTLTALMYKKMSDVPLKLDEFGKGFDKEHRFRAAEVIKAMVEQQLTPQVFMISHYEDGHGTMTHAQVCVLDKANIALPSVYNEHVIFA